MSDQGDSEHGQDIFMYVDLFLTIVNQMYSNARGNRMRIAKISTKRSGIMVVGLALAAVSVSSMGQQSPVSAAPSASTSPQQMTKAAVAFLATLTATQREASTYPFTGENRTNWSNVPMFVHTRPGLRMGDLDAPQRRAAHHLLRASMSSQGYQKVAGIMRLDRIHGDLELEELAKNGPAEGARVYYQEEADSFGSGSYSVAIFGDPASDTEWGWLIQGHHMGASFTVADGHTGFTPLFLGATPHVVEHGIHSGWSALSHEVTRGWELMAALTPEQRAVATEPGNVPGDVTTGVGHKDDLPEFRGLRAADMNAAQQRLLRILVEEYVRNSDFDAAEAQLDAITGAGWDELWFSWRGATGNPTDAFYYRVHGERILIELTQRPNHVHTIVRDPVNDYGENWLGQILTEELSANDRFEAAVRRYEGAGGDR